MDVSDLNLIGGLVLGFASSLHCAGMCGGIAASLVFSFDRSGSARRQAGILLVAQAGRITAYVVAGAFLGSVGSRFYGAFEMANMHQVMRWAAAAALGWMGLSMLGLAPPPSALDRLGAPIVRFVTAPSRLAPAGSFGGPLVAGIAWGFLPCGMVFGALFYAMLSGTGSSGGMVMLGFGLGTLPAVIGTAFGIVSLRALGRRPPVRRAAGVGLLAMAVISVIVPAAGWGSLCLV